MAAISGVEFQAVWGVLVPEPSHLAFGTERYASITGPAPSLPPPGGGPKTYVSVPRTGQTQPLSYIILTQSGRNFFLIDVHSVSGHSINLDAATGHLLTSIIANVKRTTNAPDVRRAVIFFISRKRKRDLWRNPTPDGISIRAWALNHQISWSQLIAETQTEIVPEKLCNWKEKKKEKKLAKSNWNFLTFIDLQYVGLYHLQWNQQ